MTRINVYTYPAADQLGGEFDAVELAGWFELDRADAIHEDTWWDGSNHISIPTGSQSEHQVLYRTAMGRWVLHCYSQWQGVPDTYEFISEQRARDWLLGNSRDDDVARYFGPLDEERGPGRPEVGGAVHVRLGEHLAAVDAWAVEHGAGSRADAVRRLVALALAQQQ